MIKDIVAGVIFLALSIGYYMMARAFPISALDTTVSSAAFPEVLAIAGAALSILLIANALWKGRAVAALPAGISPAEEELAEDRVEEIRVHKRALGLFVILAGYILILETLGYVVSLGLMILAVAMYHDIKPSPKLGVVAVVGAIFFWLFFDRLLGVTMPAGIWPF